MDKTIFVLIEKCVACKSCEIACAVEHSRSKTLFGAMSETPRPKPRVRVEKAGAFSYPARCMHCEDAACIAACPTGAMTRNAVTHSVYVDTHKCIGCWMCAMVCAFGAIGADASGTKAYKCDRCPDRVGQGLDPACVAACPTRAMIFGTVEDIAAPRRGSAALGAAAMLPPPVVGSVQVWRNLKGEA